MLDDEKFDFSKETKIKDKLLNACLDKIKQNQQVRKPVTIDELNNANKSVTRIQKNNCPDKTIKIEKEK